jgi:hypothetical protein
MLSFPDMDMTTFQWLAFVRVKEEFAPLPFKDFRHDAHMLCSEIVFACPQSCGMVNQPAYAPELPLSTRKYVLEAACGQLQALAERLCAKNKFSLPSEKLLDSSPAKQ